MGEGYFKTIDELQLPTGDFVLALPGWYPTWLDPHPGDFNQRQVIAAGLYMPQVVLYVGKDQSNTILKTEVKFRQLNKQVVEILVVYPVRKLKLHDVLHTQYQYTRLLFQYANLVIQKWGKPLLLHSYIVMRGGLGGYLLGKKWKLPYILTEHWTIFYPADPGYLQKRNAVFKSLVKRAYKNAAHFLPVTNSLYGQAQKLLGPLPHTIVPNVVETEIFNFSNENENNKTFRFLHISTMIYQKNPGGLLRAFKKFNLVYPRAQLYMVGPYDKEVYEYYESLQFTKEAVIFTGAVSYANVSTLIKESNALVLFSRYENLPCVILETFCCGNPVIATRVGGIDEVVNPGNGILINSEDEEALFEAMKSIFTNYKIYDRQKIARKANELYSYRAVGALINSVYEKIADLK